MLTKRPSLRICKVKPDILDFLSTMDERRLAASLATEDVQSEELE